MNQDCIGIWQFNREEGTKINAEGSINSVYTFIYENDSLIIYLPSDSSFVGLPKDDIFRIKTKWKGNELYIFPPLGNRWELFATWDNNIFVMYGGGKVKLFKKIEAEEIAKWQQNLLKAGREMWSYHYINPDEVEIA
jgi:hypothetical protein